MAITNHERVGTAMELLRQGLAPFVDRELHSRVETGAVHMEVLRRFEIDKPYREWDAAALLRLMWETWRDVFSDTFGYTERSLVSELREWRNKWAHQERFSSDDADRALDSAERLLTAVSRLTLSPLVAIVLALAAGWRVPRTAVQPGSTPAPLPRLPLFPPVGFFCLSAGCGCGPSAPRFDRTGPFPAVALCVAN